MRFTHTHCFYTNVCPTCEHANDIYVILKRFGFRFRFRASRCVLACHVRNKEACLLLKALGVYKALKALEWRLRAS